MKKENKIGFSLIKIQTEQFAFFEEIFDEKLIVNLNTQIEFKLNFENKIVGSFIGFTFEQQERPFLKIEVSCHFAIENNSLTSFLDTTKLKISIPKDFLAHLAMITVGTTRGILFAKTEGTSLNKFIIPTLNVSEMIEGNAEFSTNE